MKSGKREGKFVQANVSTFKTHLGRYLKIVKAGGEVIVLDRNHPIAKLTAIQDTAQPIVMRAPVASWSEVLAEIEKNSRVINRTKLKRDSLTYLEEDRDRG